MLSDSGRGGDEMIDARPTLISPGVCVVVVGGGRRRCVLALVVLFAERYTAEIDGTWAAACWPLAGYKLAPSWSSKRAGESPVKRKLAALGRRKLCVGRRLRRRVKSFIERSQFMWVSRFLASTTAPAAR